eukprot:5822388-Pyramimonas_sp.AAC.1
MPTDAATTRPPSKLSLEDLLDESRFLFVFDLELGGAFAVAPEDCLSREREDASAQLVGDFMQASQPRPGARSQKPSPRSRLYAGST